MCFYRELINEEVLFLQLMLKFSSGDQKKKDKAILTLQFRVETFSTLPENDGIVDRKQYLEGLSFFMAKCHSIRDYLT